MPRFMTSLRVSKRQRSQKKLELGNQVTMVDTIKDHDTSLALARAVILPNNVVDLSTEGSEET